MLRFVFSFIFVFAHKACKVTAFFLHMQIILHKYGFFLLIFLKMFNFSVSRGFIGIMSRF